jgi:hypothetical protein
MDFTKILLLYNNVEKCKKNYYLFRKYNHVICDYHTNINKEYNYDIIINEITEKNEENIVIYRPNDIIYVANIFNIEQDEYIKKILENGYDMCVCNDLNETSVSLILNIYKIIRNSMT